MNLLRGFIKNNDLFVIIFVLAFLVRVIYPENVILDGDEQLILFNASKTNLGNFYNMLGARISVSTLSLGPLLLYANAIILYLFKDILFLFTFNIFLNLLSLIFIYLFLKKHFSQRAALLASSFYAFSPTVIIYSRRIINNTPAPILTVLLLWLLYEIIFSKKHQKDKKIFFLPILFSLGFHIHVSLIGAMIASLVILCFFWKKINKKYLIYGLMATFLINAFYLRALINDNSSQKAKNSNPVTILFKKDTTNLSSEPFSYLNKMLLLKSHDSFNAIVGSITPWNRSLYFIPFFSWVAFFYLVFEKKRKIRMLGLFYLFAFIPFIFLGQHATRFYWFFIPLVFILGGAFGDILLKKIECRPILFKTSNFLFFVFLTGNLIFSFYFLRITNSLGYIPESGTNLLTLKTKRDIAEALDSLNITNFQTWNPDNLHGFSSQLIFMDERRSDNNLFLRNKNFYNKNNYSTDQYLFLFKKDFCVQSIINKKAEIDAGENIKLITLDSSLDYSSLAVFNEKEKKWKKSKSPIDLSKQRKTVIKINYLRKKDDNPDLERWVIIPYRTFFIGPINIQSFMVNGEKVERERNNRFDEYYIFKINNYADQESNEIIIESKVMYPDFIWGNFSIFDLQISKDYCFYDDSSSEINFLMNDKEIFSL